MVCIYCGSSTQVSNSRQLRRNNKIWRRRRCKACKAVFTTHEAPDLDSSLMVRKNGLLEPFHKNLLFISIYESCRHRDKALADTEELTQTVIRTLTREHTRRTAELPTVYIIETVLSVLHNFDPAAETFYRAYHAKRRS